jgi:GNAT superfamily N-acetyltransferase
MDTITIRPARAIDEPFLWEMLYQAVYVPPGGAPVPREIVGQPELNRYVAGWGQAGDVGFIAEENGQPIGAAWLRLLPGEKRGYGYVDDHTPELTMAVAPNYRSRGIGTRLLTYLLAEAARQYPAVSLSVAAENPARRLYERHGFVTVGKYDGSLTMLRHFSEPREYASKTSA